MRKANIRNFRLFLLSTVFCLCTLGAAAIPPHGPQGPQGPQGQNKSQHGEQIRNMKIAYLTDALQLTPEQSQKFWPVYNAYWAARREVGRKRGDLYKVIRTGQVGEQQFNDLLGLIDDERKIMAEYIEKFRQILPNDKAAKVFVADEDFKNFLLRRATNGGGPKQTPKK